MKGHDCKHFTTVIHFWLNSPKNADLYTPITKNIHHDNPMESHAYFGLKSNIHYKPNHILIWRFPDMEVPQIQAIRPWLSTKNNHGDLGIFLDLRNPYIVMVSSPLLIPYAKCHGFSLFSTSSSLQPGNTRLGLGRSCFTNIWGSVRTSK